MSAAEQAIGVDVALFVSEGAEMAGDAFVKFGALLRAGHATQSQWLGGSRSCLD